jgi:integrase/recombinase XerD
MSIQDALTRYMRQLQADGRSSHTVAQARRLIGMLVRWLEDGGGPTDVRRLRHEHVAAFLVSPVLTRTRQGRPRKASSANAIRTALRQFGRWLVDAAYTRENPCRLVRLARCSPAPPRSLSDGEISRLLAAIDGSDDPLAARDGALVRLMLGTGLRLGSALGLHVDDVDLRTRTLTVHRVKNAAPFDLPISAEVTRGLRSHLRSCDGDWLFAGRGGGPLTTREAGYRLRRWARVAGLEGRATAHALRHTYAQRLYDRTSDIVLVRAALGHRCLSSSTAYARVGGQALRAALGR